MWPLTVHARCFQLDPATNMALISHRLAQPAFVVYLLLAIAVVGFLIFYAAPRWGDSNLLVYVLICALTGSLNVMAAKGVGAAARNSYSGRSDLEFSNGLTYVFLANTIACSAVQMVYLNRALRAYAASVVSPIYYAAFTLFVTIATAILYREFDAMAWWDVVGFVAGIVVSLVAVGFLVFFKAWSRSIKKCGQNDSMPFIERASYFIPIYFTRLDFHVSLFHSHLETGLGRYASPRQVRFRPWFRIWQLRVFECFEFVFCKYRTSSSCKCLCTQLYPDRVRTQRCSLVSVRRSSRRLTPLQRPRQRISPTSGQPNRIRT